MGPLIMQNRQFYRGVTFIQVDEPATPTVGDTWLGTETGECVQIYTGSGPDQGWKRFGGSCLETVNIDFLLPADYIQEDSTTGTQINGIASLISDTEYVYDFVGQYIGSGPLFDSLEFAMFGNYAITTMNGKFGIIDTSDPNNLTYHIYEFSTIGNGKRLHVKDDYIITNINGDTLRVFNASDINNITTTVGLTHPDVRGIQDIVSDSNYLYVACYDTDCLAIFDATDLANSVSYVASISDNVDLDRVNRLDIFGNYVYISGPNTFSIIDVTNRNIPVKLSTITSVAFSNTTSLKIVGNYVYVSDYNNDSILIIDVTDVNNPFIKSSLIDNTNLNKVKDIAISGNYLYATGYPGICVIDISDPNNMFVANTIVNQYLERLNRVFIIDDNLYTMTDFYDSFTIIDISDPLNIPCTSITYDYNISQPYYITTKTNSQIDLTNNNLIKTCEIIHDEPANTTIFSLISFDNKSNWMKYNTTNSVWETHAGGLTNLQTGNTISEIILGLTDLDVSSYSTLDFAFDLNTTESTNSPTIDEINLILYY